MKRELFEQHLVQCPIMAILRGITVAEGPAVCDILHEAGINLLEIPLNTHGAIEALDAAVRHCANRQLVGAGTVLAQEQVQTVKAAGGEFIISPNTDLAVIRETVRLGMLSMPGFLTPTEAFAALTAGAHYLKFFPAGNFGVSYIKNLQAVIKAPIFAVGGVKHQNLADFLTVCQGVGIGGNLYKPGKTLEEIQRDAAEFARIATASSV